MPDEKTDDPGRRFRYALHERNVRGADNTDTVVTLNYEGGNRHGAGRPDREKAEKNCSTEKIRFAAGSAVAFGSGRRGGGVSDPVRLFWRGREGADDGSDVVSACGGIKDQRAVRLQGDV